MKITVKNKFKAVLSVAKAYVLKKPVPLSVVLTTNTRCNYSCGYCKMWTRKEELNTIQIKNLIDELAAMGTCRLSFTGGEPLLRDDIGQLIDYAKSKGFYLTLNSNGSLVESKIGELRNLDLLILSFDGEESIHNLQKIDGAYTKVIAAIKIAKSHGVKVWTTTTITKHNLHSIDFIIKKAIEMQFNPVFQLLHHAESIAGNTDHLLASKDDYKKVLMKLIEYKKKYKDLIVNSKKYFEILLNWPDYSKPVREDNTYALSKIKCWAGRLYCHIDATGGVYPCQQLIGVVDAPNFLNIGFKKAFYSISKTKCKMCIAGDYLENNLLFSLDICSIRNALNKFADT
ncbi:MAG: radical SAM protein [bacterium]|nr:radical SAM protein [bacterium]